MKHGSMSIGGTKPNSPTKAYLEAINYTLIMQIENILYGIMKTIKLNFMTYIFLNLNFL